MGFGGLSCENASIGLTDNCGGKALTGLKKNLIA